MMTVDTNAKDADDFTIFEQSLHPIIVCLLACGLSDDALLHRLYDEQLSA
ncbi:hypothetical protein [Shewanella sp. NIFS-20-20]|nr:hypothetical protein [Shewanella sp. NIFS-20-20]MBV7317571.1 hypothetical protein [Shewanella sp. NIFS-20-20]